MTDSSDLWCDWIMFVADRYVYKFYRQQRASPVIYLIVSIGTMFIIGGSFVL